MTEQPSEEQEEETSELEKVMINRPSRPKEPDARRKSAFSKRS